jgi:hypothetical protein
MTLQIWELIGSERNLEEIHSGKIINCNKFLSSEAQNKMGGADKSDKKPYWR